MEEEEDEVDDGVPSRAEAQRRLAVVARAVAGAALLAARAAAAAATAAMGVLVALAVLGAPLGRWGPRDPRGGPPSKTRADAGCSARGCPTKQRALVRGPP